MTTENGLRIAIGLIFFGIISIQIYYHRLTHEEGNIKEMKQHPLQSGVIAIMGFLNMFLIAAYIIWGEEILGWALLAIPNLFRWMGVVIGGSALVFFFWTHKMLGENFSHTTRIQDDQELVTNGPYRYVQHPMYTSFLLFTISFFLITANWLIGVCWLLGVSLLIFIRLPREEMGLRAHFGEAYKNYSQTTARIIPGVW